MPKTSTISPEYAVGSFGSGVSVEIGNILDGSTVEKQWCDGVEELMTDPHASVMSEADLLARHYKARTLHEGDVDKFATRNAKRDDVDIIFAVESLPAGKRVRVTTTLQGQLPGSCTITADSDGNFDVLCRVYERGQYHDTPLSAGMQARVLRAFFYDTLQATEMIDDRSPEEARAADAQAKRLLLLHLVHGHNI